MMDDLLSQDEINALLQGAAKGEDQGSAQGQGAFLGEISSLFAEASGNVMGMLAGREVSCTPREPLKLAQSGVPAHFDEERVLAFRFLCDGLDNAPMAILLSERTGLLLADLMMGGDGKELPAETNDLYLSASQEGLSQIIGAALTGLSGLLGGKRLVPSAAAAILEEGEWLPLKEAEADRSVFLLSVDVAIDQLDPVTMSFVLPESETLALAEALAERMAPPPSAASAPSSAPSAGRPQGEPQPQQASSRRAEPPVDVRPAQFSPLSAGEEIVAPENLDLILDIPVTVTVELGRTSRTIGEVLGFGPGSVLELEKMAGEPVDVLVNGKLVARGEVVVIDENFGVRISEIVSKAERIRSIGR